EALSFPRDGRDRVPRPRHRRDRVSVRSRDALRGSRDGGRGDGGARGRPRSLPGGDARAHRALPPRAGRSGNRLPTPEHEPPAGACADVLSLDEGQSAVMLTFLAPAFLLGAAAAAIPVILHLLKREPEARVKFAAVKMLKDAPVEHPARHRLRELRLLALRVATLLLLALAFARPFSATAGGATVSGVRIVALDTSDSLSAPGRFDRAKQLARDAVAHAGAGALVGVVTFADTAGGGGAPAGGPGPGGPRRPAACGSRRCRGDR